MLRTDSGFFDEQLLGLFGAVRVVLHRGGAPDMLAQAPIDESQCPINTLAGQVRLTVRRSFPGTAALSN